MRLTHGVAVSLNRSEQTIFDYLEQHLDERHFWQQKVQTVARQSADDHGASLILEGELWAYYVERSAVAEPFRSMAAREGLPRTSMRNLAEYLLRLWTVPRPKKKKSAGPV